MAVCAGATLMGDANAVIAVIELAAVFGLLVRCDTDRHIS